MIRNLILDWSGTLVDDLPAVWRATNQVFQRAGAPELSLERFRAEFALPFDGFYRRYLPGVAPSDLERWFHGHYREHRDSVQALPHALAFLQFCRRRGLRTLLLTAVTEEHFLAQAERSGLGHYLDHLCLGVWDKRTRIRGILEEKGWAAPETLFVGDMQHDMEAARHGGVRACGVLTGYNRLEQLRQSQPDLIVEHLGELHDLLERHSLDPFSLAGGASSAEGLPVATVGALIVNDAGEVLMIRTHKWSDLWGIPGGKIKRGETAEAALRRELLEETALEIEDIRFALVQDCIGSKEFYRDAHFVLLNYTCRAPGRQEVRLNEEAQEYRWLPVVEAMELPLNQPTRRLLETVLAGTAPAR